MASSMLHFSDSQQQLSGHTRTNTHLQQFATVRSSPTTNSICSMTSQLTSTASSLDSSACPSPRTGNFLFSSTSSLSSASTGFSVVSTTSRNAPKKRSNLFSGLFSTKEPSGQALLDYQRRLEKQGNGRITAVGLPGISTARLPATVPKVNSKWDGIPQSHKDREIQWQRQSSSRPSMSSDARTLSTAGSSGSSSRSRPSPTLRECNSQDTLGGASAHSTGSNRLADLYGWENPESFRAISARDFAKSHSRPPTARSMSSAKSVSPPVMAPTVPLQDPSQASVCIKTYAEQPSPKNSPEIPEHSNSPCLTPSEPSPVTPDAPSFFLGLDSPYLENTSDYPKPTTVEAPGTAHQVIVRSAGINILGPPATAKRRAKLTTYASHGVMPETKAQDPPLNSILKKGDKLVKEMGLRTLGAPTRNDSARQRLGFGMTLRKQASPPW